MSEDRAPYHVNHHPDEIDLRELACTLWAQKVLIVLCTVVITGLAAAYAFLSTPVYEAEGLTLPATPADLASYNVVTQVDRNFESLDPDTAYKIFLRHLNSASLKLDFFDNYYLPEVHAEEPTAAERESLWKRFNKELSVALPRNNEGDLATVTMQGESPTVISEWVNQYIKEALSRSNNQVLSTLESAISVRLQSTESEIATLRESAEQERLNQIARVEEALHLARSVGLETPPDSGNLITSYTGETTYLRGARALESELQLLKARDNNDPYIEHLPEQLRRLNVLQKINLQPDSLSVASIDSWSVPPEAPIKPKKALILLLGFVVGGMLGVFIALMRHWLKKP